MIDPKDLRDHVICPVLRYLDPLIPYSVAGENLVIGTCAQESGMGRYLIQLGNGPALGIYQMEPKTENDIWRSFLSYRSELASTVESLSGINTLASSDLIGNLFYATAMCRIHYFRRREPLPEENDIEGMAHYWKAYYNTIKGKGTTEEFIRNYSMLVK